MRKMQGSDLLDIGVICSEMAGHGIARATLVEASPAYLEIARREVSNRFTMGCTQFVLGDFTIVSAKLPKAYAVTLGRVVCCYPDVEGLLLEVAEHTRHILAFTYPRSRWYIRVMNAIQNLWRRSKGDSFQTYIHSPELMEKVLSNAGLVRKAQKATFVWMLDVYERTGA